MSDDDRYKLIDMPMNLMAEGDVFMGANGEWFLVTEIDRVTEHVVIHWKGGKEETTIPHTVRFNVLLPVGYDIAARDFGAKY